MSRVLTLIAAPQRVYEKGKQEIAQWDGSDPMPPVEWIRVELEVKPQDRMQKQKLAILTPETLWGVSRWTREIHSLLVGTVAERQVMWESKQTTEEESVRYMLQQYRNPLQIVAAAKGGPEPLWEYFEEVWAEQDRAREYIYGLKRSRD